MQPDIVGAQCAAVYSIYIRLIDPVDAQVEQGNQWKGLHDLLFNFLIELRPLDRIDHAAGLF